MPVTAGLSYAGVADKTAALTHGSRLVPTLRDISKAGWRRAGRRHCRRIKHHYQAAVATTAMSKTGNSHVADFHSLSSCEPKWRYGTRYAYTDGRAMKRDLHKRQDEAGYARHATLAPVTAKTSTMKAPVFANNN